MKLPIPKLDIPETEITEDFIRSSGPGGQNVNKVASAVQLRFNIRTSSLAGEVRQRLIALAGRRVNSNGELVITARKFREQALNRAEARRRLAELLAQAYTKPKKRRKTRPTLASKQRRLTSKLVQGKKKKQRRGNWDE